MTVYITIPAVPPEHFHNATLCFNTLRTGFPNVRIHVDIQRGGLTWENSSQLIALCKMVKATIATIQPMTHARWIKEKLMQAPPNERIIFLDGDTIFWASCEDLDFPTVLAGYRIPRIWNEFSASPSAPRLHTSFLWIESTRRLNQAITNALAAHKVNEYCPTDPFSPNLVFTPNGPLFFDCCSILYNLVGGTAFSPDVLDRYDHLNSACFYDTMVDRLENKEGFRAIHRLAKENPKKLKGLWKEVNEYYREMELRAIQYTTQRMSMKSSSVEPILSSALSDSPTTVEG